MKIKIVLNSLASIVLISTAILFANVFFNEYKPLKKYESFLSFNKNLIKNGKFENDFKNWYKDENVVTTNIGTKTYAHIHNNDFKQIRIWQSVDVVSGKTYRLTFKLKDQQLGAFVIYRDIKTGQEQYLWCSGDDDIKTYIWDITPERSGKNNIYLSTNKPGDYYYANISLKIYNQHSIIVCAVILLFLFIIFPYYYCEII